MKRLLPLIVLFFAVATAFGQVTKLNPIQNPSLDELRQTFKSPPRDYSTGPLWTWNDLLTEEQVRSTLRDLAGQNVKQVWVHPRPGLMTPYLSDDWFRLWKASIDEAEKLDMNVWIYDENSYPSGFAGGFVPEALPDSRGMGLRFEEVEKLDSISKDVWYVFNAAGKNVTDAAKKDGKLPPQGNNQKYLIGKVQYAPSNGWFGGKWFVDLVKKGVTEKFIEITHEAYKKNIGEHFGKRVPGIFTDEPHLAGAYAGTWVTWNEEIPSLFEKKFGYSLIENLLSLHKPVGDWRKVRHNYHQLMLDTFIERWAMPNYEWCEKNNLEWTGHYWEHGWPETSHCPDNMAMYIWHQRPSIDLLMNTYNDNSPNAQFGSVRAVKELASIVNQMGRSRTLSENYGAGGWDLRFEDMKRLGDWSYALGVNTNNEHLSYVTIRGARKRDHPQSFSYHAPWFEGYRTLADYFTRLSYMLSQGRQINRVVVLEPTTTAWMYQGEAKLGEIGRNFTEFVNALEHAQVEYDLASEDTISRFGKVSSKKFFINLGEYDLVILPPNTENLNRPTAELLMQYVQNGGRLLYAELPSRCDGVELDSGETALVKRLAESPSAQKVSPAEAVVVAKARTAETGLNITVPEGTRSVFHHRRTLPDCEVLFICNADQEKTVRVEIKVPQEKYFSLCNLQNGKQFNARQAPNGTFPMPLRPSGSVMFVISDTAITDAESFTGGPRRQGTPISGTGTNIKRLDPNVLTLDFVDVKVGNEERKDIYTYQADQWIWQKNGFEKNPFDNEVQFKDELLKKTFPADSGFTATYRFTLDGFDSLPKPLYLVIERPDLYKASCNGKPLAMPEHTSGTTPEFKDWYLDKSFGKLDISEAVRNGDNEVTITTSPLTVWTALEPAYLIGDFSLRPASKGFVVCPAQPLVLKKESASPEMRHNDEIENVSWLSAGVNFRPNSSIQDRSPTLTFEFDKEYSIAAIRIWNYNERNLQRRGVKAMNVTGLGEIKLPLGTGIAVEFPFTGQTPLKKVEFKILSNHAGTTYPIPENAKPDDSGFAGLSEVQFLVKDGDKLVPIKNVTAKASSELVVDNHNRRAQFLVDGSGLGLGAIEQGWHRQGMPFYAGKVEYSRSFEVANVAGTYSVRLPESAPGATDPTGWYGATARVVVNGNDAGYVVSAPWQVDVTKFVKQGKNDVSVQVYGTPKNLLGPHHMGKLRGSAWPGSFQHGPDEQPHGLSYDVIGYGLFEEFTLMSAP